MQAVLEANGLGTDDLPIVVCGPNRQPMASARWLSGSSSQAGGGPETPQPRW